MKLHDTKMTDTMTDTIKLLGRMLTFSMIYINSAEPDEIEQALQSKIKTQGASNIPVVIDTDITQDLTTLFTIIRNHGLQPIGVVEGVLSEQAEAQHVAIFPKGKALEKVEKKTDQGNTMIYEKVMRSGQSVANSEGDLIVTNGVNNGAEAIATGSLHIYGKAQGRLVAGATGEPTAGIFCQYFDPTLVSIAGVYCLRENMPEDLIGKAVIVKYQKDSGLTFTAMNPAIQ